MASDWKAPYVCQGDIVLWYDGPDAKAHPFAAIVTKVDGQPGMVDVLAFPTSAYNGIPHSGVRHANDPNKRAIENQADGVWTHTERRQLEDGP